MLLVNRRLTAAALVLLLASACSSEEDAPAPEGEPAPEGIEGVQAIAAEGDRRHVEDPVDYELRPPAGGDHFPTPAPCAFYGSLAERPPDELIVHSLEHGAVWIAFQEDLPEEQQELIRQATEASDHVIATPYEDLRAPVVLTAWERQLDLDSVGDERFEGFLSTYVQGPTTPEEGAAC